MRSKKTEGEVMRGIALYGLGEMGAEIARCLVGRGVTLATYDPVADPKINAPNHFPGSLVETAAKASVHLVVVKRLDDLETLIFGKNGIAARAPEKSLIILHTTVTPQVVLDLRRRVAEMYGHTVLDVALSRRAGKISEGSLSLLVGGTDDDFIVARPMLNLYADNVVHVGPPGAGMTAKLCNNWLLYGNRHAALQALKAGQSLGLDVDVLRNALATSTGSSWALAHYSDLDAAIVAGTGAPDVVRERTASELGMVQEMMEATGVLPTTLRETLTLVDAMRPGTESWPRTRDSVS